MFIFVWAHIFALFTRVCRYFLSGSQWHIGVADGHEYTFSFKPGGACTYMKIKSPSGNEGKIYDNCSWQQNGNVIMFQTNNYACFLEK